jgi:hypothetical protein
MRRGLPVAFAAALALAPAARAEEDTPRWPDSPGGSLSVISENDKWAFHGDDKHYTNGLRLGWISDPVDRAGLVRRFADSLPIFDPAGEIRLGFAIGQSIFTPTDLETAQPIPTDRPYAGWLYLSAALVGERFGGAGGAPDRLDTLELSLGVMGPAAGGERLQKPLAQPVRRRRGRGLGQPDSLTSPASCCSTNASGEPTRDRSPRSTRGSRSTSCPSSPLASATC